MSKTEDKNTRYYIEVDTKTGKIIRRDFGDKHKLAQTEPDSPDIHRIYLTKGQYHKFVRAMEK